MYKVENPKFLINVYIKKYYFIDMVSDTFDEDYINERKDQFALAFHNKFKGVLFDVQLEISQQYAIFRIRFPFVLHKTVLNKIRDWVLKNYNVAFFNIRGVQ